MSAGESSVGLEEAFGLAGSRVLVTGGGQGIGARICEVFALCGAKVAVADLDEEAAARVAKGLPGDQGAVHVTGDVSDREAAAKMVGDAADRLGGLDVMVNNAGIWTIKPLLQMSGEELTRDVEVCLMGTIYCCQSALPLMEEEGAIVNVGSDAGRIGEPSLTTYSAAKGGVMAFTKALAKEAAPVRVNAIAPGMTKTPGSTAGMSDELMTRALRAYPLRRMGEPDDQAWAALFLASPKAGWITGQILSVNGGYAT